MRIHTRKRGKPKKAEKPPIPVLRRAFATGAGVAALALAALLAVLVIYPVGAVWGEAPTVAAAGGRPDVSVTYGNNYAPASPVSWMALYLDGIGRTPKRAPWKSTGVDYGNTRVPLQQPAEAVRLAWQYRPKTLEALPEGVNALAPTWFYVESDHGVAEVNALDELREGKVKGWDPAQYVRKAHAGGAQVWGCVVSFEPELSRQIVTDAGRRKEFLDRLVAWVKEYDLDGINFDFEKMDPADKEKYNDLLAECKRKLPPGSVVSACVTVPMGSEDTGNWWQCYDRQGMARIVDYVAVMTYDSPDVQPVAPIDWVEARVRAILDQVPSDKLLLGVPFYGSDFQFDVPKGERLTELPKLTKSKTSGTILPSAMASLLQDGSYTSGGKKVVVDYWVDKGSWQQEQAVARYAFVDTDGLLHLIYCEDTRSLEDKGRLLTFNRLAGFAVWRMEYGNEPLWRALQRGMELPK